MMNSHCAPKEKLRALINCCKVIIRTSLNGLQWVACLTAFLELLNGAENVAGADDFLPHLCIVVLRAYPPHLHSNVRYLRVGENDNLPHFAIQIRRSLCWVTCARERNLILLHASRIGDLLYWEYWAASSQPEPCPVRTVVNWLVSFGKCALLTHSLRYMEGHHGAESSDIPPVPDHSTLPNAGAQKSSILSLAVPLFPPSPQRTRKPTPTISANPKVLLWVLDRFYWHVRIAIWPLFGMYFCWGPASGGASGALERFQG